MPGQLWGAVWSLSRWVIQLTVGLWRPGRDARRRKADRTEQGRITGRAKGSKQTLGEKYMALQGTLQEMNVADLIQKYGQDQRQAQLTVQHNGEEASVYFKEGRVAHAVLGDESGEEVIYQILNWEDGQFSLEMDVDPPAETITRSWSALLLEGARRLDEANQKKVEEEKQTVHKEAQPMATRKSDRLAEALQELLDESADINGAAVVGTDGLVYSVNVPNREMDQDMVGAASAAVLGLSRRSVEQLQRGAFTRTLIQGDDGNIIVSGLTNDTLFVGLTPQSVNLGMAFAEVRDVTERLLEIL
jgi:predicted regulator of Ras-like GTPase activity (Roadblock/LC7/MglB family)